MFNNRQSRRRFRLGNLARLVQLRQSVSQQPPPRRRTLQETWSQSPPHSPPQSPSFQLPPTQFLSPITSTSTVPSPHSPPQLKSSPVSPLPPKLNEEHQSQPMSSKHVTTHRSLLIQSPPISPPEYTESLALVPHTPPTPEAKPLSPTSKLKATEESQSQPSPPLNSSDETRFLSPPPPPSLSEPKSQMPSSPPEAKTPSSSPLTVDANEEFNSKMSPPSTSTKETQLKPSPPTLLETPQEAMTPPPSSPPTLEANEEVQPQPSPLPSKSTDVNISQSQPISPPPPSSLSASDESHPPLPPQEAKTLPSSPSTINTKENFQSSNETRFRSSLSKRRDIPPPSSPSEAKTPPSTLNATEKSHPLRPSKSINETRFQTPLPSEAKTLPPPPPSTLNATEEPQSQPPRPSESINETRLLSSPPSLSESAKSQQLLPPPAALIPPRTLNAIEDSQSRSPRPPWSSESINQALARSSTLSETSPPSLSKSGGSQPSLPLEVQNPMLKANVEFESQTSLPFESIAETQFRSSPPPPPLSESGESQPPPETKIPPSVSATEESQSQPPPTLLPSKTIDETRSQSPVSSQTSPPSLSKYVASPSSKTKNLPSSPSILEGNKDFRSETSSPPEAKIPPSTPNDTDKSKHQSPPSLLPSKSIDRTRSHSSPISTPLPSKSTEKPKSTQPLLLSPKAVENLRSQSPMSLPTLTSQSPMKPPIPSLSTSPATVTAPPPQLKPEIISSPKPLVPQTKPKPIDESHTSPDNNKEQNHNPEKPDAKLRKKIPAENEEPEARITGKINNKSKGKAIWSAKKTEPMIMMFINSNVQGFNTSLSLDSSSIDHEPGVHLTIDSNQSCDFSSKVF
ncbi:hypothetical protein CARUB_v10000206mg [Capsella rubella]|uniref:Uncharacterized protein n=1 Tax=Capsella rubella TaxID=81985 RepID=R0FDN1_9BRAS|nr:extensin [Capsella rubella]EOA19956.1 hypothetical protein CARUB_v10000206mg [Capsella rubella]